MVPISGKPEIGGRRPGPGRHPSRAALILSRHPHPSRRPLRGLLKMRMTVEGRGRLRMTVNITPDDWNFAFRGPHSGAVDLPEQTMNNGRILILLGRSHHG